MNRSPAHRRYILPSEADCFASGKWGRRRVRTSEYWTTIRAEDSYTAVASSTFPAGASRPEVHRARCTLCALAAWVALGDAQAPVVP